MQMMLYQMTTTGAMDMRHIDSVAPWFDVALTKNPISLARMPSPRIFKTHRAFPELPKKGRFIYLVRNPKDSCVSYYYHSLLSGSSWSLPEFTARFVRGRVRWGSWFKHLDDCLRHTNDRPILVIRYDDISKARDQVVDKVSAFCGIRLDESKRLAIIDRCSLQFMKQYDRKFDPRFAMQTVSSESFVRKGLIGDWVNELAPRSARLIDRHLERTLKEVKQFLSSDELTFLDSARSTSSGTIKAEIRLEGQNRFVKSNKAVGVPHGVLLLLREGDVAAGEFVCLQLSLGDYRSIRVCLAQSIHVSKQDTCEYVTFRFVSIDETDRNSLKEFCFQAQEALFKYDDHNASSEPAQYDHLNRDCAPSGHSTCLNDSA
jgi:hypothetical protein